MNQATFDFQESPPELFPAADDPGPSGEALRDEGIARAASGAGPWIEQALAAARRILISRREMTTDDLWEAGIPRPAEPRAAGAVMREAANRNWCRATTRTVKSRRKECHCRPVRVWVSLITGRAE